MTTTTEQILEEIKAMQAKLDAIIASREMPTPATNDYMQRKAEFLNRLHAPKRAKQ